MAVTQANLGRSYSIGPVKQQRISFSVASGDTSATFTFDNLARVESVLIATLQIKTIAYTDNTAVVTFTDPAATVVGIAEAHGI